MGRQWSCAAALAVLVLMGAASGMAAAPGPGYAGTWAAKRGHCRFGQTSGAPADLGRNRYDQHEAHCTFTSVRAPGAGRWRVKARCSVEGDTQSHDFALMVTGNTLTVQDKQGTRVLRRCP